MTAAMLTPDRAVEASLLTIPKIDVARNLRAARAKGRGYAEVLTEIVRLLAGPGKLSLQEYFYYRLWDSELSLEEKRQFVGTVQKTYLHAASNDASLRQMMDNKDLFHSAMLAARLPVPELIAVVRGAEREDYVLAIDDESHLRAFLADETRYPFFAKPIDGVFSLGVFRADRYDSERSHVVLHDGSSLAVDDVARQLAKYRSGYLFQRVLAPHPDLTSLYGDRLWSVRLLVFITADGPVPFRAVCKIPTGANIADNFWRSGNMLAAVDIASGTIVRTVRGTGLDMECNIDHPDTAAPLVGRAVPNWDAVLAIGVKAAATMPGIGTQSWDIALTDRGPVILEANYGGDLNLPQLAWGRGVLDETYRAHLARFHFRVPA